MPLSIPPYRSVSVALPVTMTQLVPEPCVSIVEIVSTVDCYLVMADEGWLDGEALPTEGRWRIPAGTVYPAPVGTRLMWVAPASAAEVCFVGWP